MRLFIVRCAAGLGWIRKTVGITANLAFEGDGRSLRAFGVWINIALGDCDPINDAPV
jgi:hypothetical protein